MLGDLTTGNTRDKIDTLGSISRLQSGTPEEVVFDGLLRWGMLSWDDMANFLLFSACAGFVTADDP